MEKLPDTNQNAWQLASIQLAGISSLPIFASSIILIQKYNFTSAFFSLIIGNIVLIFIRYLMIVMSEKGRKSTLDIAKKYLGQTYWAVAVVLLFATTAWYVTQNTYASNSILYLFPANFKNKELEYIQVVVLIGVLSSIFCMEGMVIVRKCAVIFFPILLALIIAILFLTPFPHFTWSFKNFSLTGIPIVIATNLGVAADIPTFFRHSASRKTSMNALAIISIFNFGLSIIGIFLVKIITPWHGININNPLLHNNDLISWILITFIFLSAIIANITNIYSASVAWEVLAPRLARKEWLILGLGLVIVTVLIINLFSLSWFLNFADNGLVSLSLIFIAGYFIEKYMQKRDSFQKKLACSTAWVIAFALTALSSFGLVFPKLSSIYITLTSIIGVLTIYFFIQFFKGNKKVNL